jgi:fluoride ion exporter CrcB/FEX
VSAQGALGVLGATLVAGAFGAVVRAVLVARRPRAGTAAVNIVGSVGLALTLVAYGRGTVSLGVAVVLGVGLSGSLTTFSGWMAVLADGFARRPLRTVIVDLLLPLALSVALTVAVFATLG